MAEDSAEPGQMALSPTDDINEKSTTDNQKSEEQSKQFEKLVEPVKEMHEDDDLESSQSLNLVFEDLEESEEHKFTDDKNSHTIKAGNKESEHEAEKRAGDAQSSKIDDKKESKAEMKECLATENVEEETKQLQNKSLWKNKEEVEEVQQDTKLKEAEEKKDGTSIITVVKKLKSKKDDVNIENEKDTAFDEVVKDQVKIENQPKKPEVKIKNEKMEAKAGDTEIISVKETELTTPITEIKAENMKIKEKKNAKTKTSAAELEVGIVGLPTPASDLISDAELVTEKPALPADETRIGGNGAQVSERVVRWVENSVVKADDPAQPEGGPEKEIDGDDDNEEQEDEELDKEEGSCTKRKKTGQSSGTNGASTNRKSQKVVGSIIRRSIRCLNKMHAMESSCGNGKKTAESGASEVKQRDDEDSRKSPKVPQSQQNGAALPEETASADRNLLHCAPASGLSPKKENKEPLDGADQFNLHSQSLTSKSSKLQSEQTTSTTTPLGKAGRPSSQRGATAKLQLEEQQQQQQSISRETRKRRSADSVAAAATQAANGSTAPKKVCLDQREQFINSLIGSDKFTAEQLASRAEQLRAEVQDLDELARAKEMEWNEILSMRKLKEEAYLRIERRRQIMGFMEGNGALVGSEGSMPPASLSLAQQNLAAANSHKDVKLLIQPKEECSRDSSPGFKRERASKTQPNYLQPSKPQLGTENGPKIQQQQQLVDAQSPEHRQIGEGRQGPIVDVRSIIADYRLRHPDTVPRRRGRRMRNSVNVGLGAGGAMVETVGNMDSRPSSTDSCKSNSNVSDPNNAMSFKDVLVQFAKLSQQQGEPIKTPQNYPDVTLHPVAVTPTTPNSVPQTGSGSLLHGILTKSQSPRPTTFSPTLARLLTAPERERSAPTITASPHQSTQHLLQAAYQSANPVSISDFLSSSKARTEITITPVVNTPLPTHSNNLIHVDDVEEETSIIEERDSRLSMGTRDNADDRDSPPRCQGCHERAAQFVCAGCGNQWYCSRECQVAAWDDHSEVCSG